MARADDFKLGVQDSPPTPIDYTGSPLTVAFGSCHNGNALDGCVTIENDTGKTITSLVIDIFADPATINDGGGGCSSEALPIVCNYSLIDNGAEYQFLFTGLNIPTNSEWCTTDTFTIEEQGINYRDFLTPRYRHPPLSLPATCCLPQDSSFAQASSTAVVWVQPVWACKSFQPLYLHSSPCENEGTLPSVRFLFLLLEQSPAGRYNSSPGDRGCFKRQARVAVACRPYSESLNPLQGELLCAVLVGRC